MSLCGQWTLVKDGGEERRAKPLPCRSWHCEYCAPRRKSQLQALAASGDPNRFITLTINPAIGTSQEARLKILSHAWKVIIKRLRYLHPQQPIQYLALVEATKNGEPHLHILYRGPYVKQSLLSAAMEEIAASPIVDIRRIRGLREVIRYVAKYVTKAPAQFGTSKRYWHSADYDLAKDTYEQARFRPSEPWRIVREDIRFVINQWFYDGYTTVTMGNGTIRGVPIDWSLT